MAELSTIARPYAQGLFKAAADAHYGKEKTEELAQCADTLAQIAGTPEAKELAGDPNVTHEALYKTFSGLLGEDAPKEALNLLKVVIENGRLDAMAEIARQFRELKNLSEGVANAYIESAFPLGDDQVASLVASLGKCFPGVRLTPVVTVNKDLIGGVCVRVGDQVLDGSVRARLVKMQEALTA